jgi:hypothetical protein
MTRYDCMTPEELAFWRSSRYTRATVPCNDCPLWFELQARATGTCRRETPERRAQMQAYSVRQREQRAAASRGYRARQRASIGAQS